MTAAACNKGKLRSSEQRCDLQEQHVVNFRGCVEYSIRLGYALQPEDPQHQGPVNLRCWTLGPVGPERF